MADRSIVYMRLDELQGDERNPKGHDLDEMRASLGRFGYTEPIMLDDRTGKLVSGHGRVELLLAEHDAGAELPDGIRADADGMWLAPVTRGWSSKDDAEAGAYLIAANSLTIRGGWRPDALTTLLDELSTSEAGLSGVGYDADDLADMLAMLGAVTPIDDLANRHGASKPEDFWPTLHFKVAPEVQSRFLALVGSLPEEERFAELVLIAHHAHHDTDQSCELCERAEAERAAS